MVVCGANFAPYRVRYCRLVGLAIFRGCTASLEIDVVEQAFLCRGKTCLG